MGELVLYHALFSTCSQKVRFALAAKGLDYESRIIDLRKSEHLESWYLAINPNGVVPALTHDGVNIVDSSVICEYLDEMFPEPALAPRDALGRAHMRAWMRYFEEVPTAAIRAPSFNKLFAKEIAARPDNERRKMGDKSPLRKHFYKKLRKNGFSDDIVAESTDRLESCLARVEKAVAAGGPYILGEKMTIADIVLLPTIVRMLDIGMEDKWADYAGIGHWLDLMMANDAFERAYPPGSRVGANA